MSETTRDRILDAAERLFAAGGGPDGASMRDIAAEAGVRLSHVTYYFAAKEALYRAVFARRAEALAAARAAALAEAPPGDVTALMRAFVGPSVRQRFGTGAQGAAFALLTALEATSPREAERGIIADFFDPTAERFLAALARLHPDAPRDALVEAYLFAMGALVTAMAGTDRLRRLTGSLTPEEAPEALAERLARFCAAGVEAILAPA
ncbi:TetR family transcriptional regulator [Roseomonas sp. OT10]|uniref:TetR/AcrR family transcriptional regulator n=1 Tax=Roseomonas cutis TaxID=2897332 RepID=UPI001E45AA4F|nr:TetR family transcriptional regulator [Roseomonas sp. OT10]UFN49811.1 TetR family transcriptional regulator [Roseomonas sp. OT10]